MKPVCGMNRSRGWGIFAAFFFLFAALTISSNAQTPDGSGLPGGPSSEVVDAPIIDDGGVTLAESENANGLSLLWLIGQGGALMLPIYLASIVTIAVVIERFISLRRAKVMPPELIDELIPRRPDGAMDPRSAYSLCQINPSPAANVIRTMLLKVGRPHAEVERAVEESSEREANRMYANVRWLNLIAAVTPLIGLLGTVWGMIRAFFDTTQLTVGQNKADFLASGIYVALVTTLGGLAVAIPAAVFAHYFEGRIQRIIHQIEELLFNLLPHVERYEGRMRMNSAGTVGGDGESGAPANGAESGLSDSSTDSANGGSTSRGGRKAGAPNRAAKSAPPPKRLTPTPALKKGSAPQASSPDPPPNSDPPPTSDPPPRQRGPSTPD